MLVVISIFSTFLGLVSCMLFIYNTPRNSDGSNEKKFESNWKSQRAFWKPGDKLEPVDGVYFKPSIGEHVYYIGENASEKSVWLYRTNNPIQDNENFTDRWMGESDHIHLLSYKSLFNHIKNPNANIRKRRNESDRRIKKIERDQIASNILFDMDNETHDFDSNDVHSPVLQR